MKKRFLALSFISLFSASLVSCSSNGVSEETNPAEISRDDKGKGGIPSTLIDARDGKEYRIVKIGSQGWMAENLKFMDVIGDESIAGQVSIDSLGNTLYSYDGAMAGTDFNGEGYNDGICPPGSHLPTMEEFDVLRAYVSEACGGYVDSCLRSKDGWENPGYDKFGFNATYSPDFDGAIFWTSTPANGTRINSDYGYSSRSNSYDAVAYGMRDGWDANSFRANFYSKSQMFYVRCVIGSVRDSASYMKSYFEKRDEREEFLSSSAAYVAYLSSSSAAEWAKIKQGAKLYFNPDLTYGEFVDDRDGQTYGYLQIGNHVWMAENMRYYFEGMYLYRDGCEGFVECSARNRQDSVAYFATGMSYVDSLLDQVCPSGWHVPSKAEWDDLFAADSNAGAYLATDGQWPDYDYGYFHVNNATGFTAIATTRETQAVFNETFFWTSSDSVEVHEKIDTVYVDSLVPVDTVAVLDSVDLDSSLVEPAPVTTFILDTTRTEVKLHVFVEYNWARKNFLYDTSSGTDYNFVRCVKD